MQRREWKELGQALKNLRRGRDLAQKEVVTLSGLDLGERALRSYESGEQRPSRERLLRLLVKSFEIAQTPEINRYLGIAKYTPLTGSEILQYGLESVVTNSQRSSPGAPVDFRVEVSTVIATDGEGREVWRHRFPTRFAQGGYDNRDAIRHCAFADIDGDGRVETLFVQVPLDFGSVGTTLICFAEDGTPKWRFVPGKTVRDSTGRAYFPPYFISNVQVIPIPDAPPRILVSSNHYLHNPNQIAMLDENGNLISEYWHSGHLLSVIHQDIDGDGVEEILLAGVNNGYRQATLVIFDPRSVTGASSQPGRQILGFEPGRRRPLSSFHERAYRRSLRTTVCKPFGLPTNGASWFPSWRACPKQRIPA